MTCFDEASMTSDYARYLAAKTTVDDRALNRHVLAELCRLMPAGAPRVLEVGAGLGTMVARLMDWGAVGNWLRVNWSTSVSYTHLTLPTTE